MSVYPVEKVPDIDLGHGHYLTFTTWHPDDLPANREWLGIPDGPLPVVHSWGATIRHYRKDGMLCESCIEFDGHWQRKVHQLEVERAVKEGRTPRPLHVWRVDCWEPLTCYPSLLCKMPILDADGNKIGECGDHGYIKAGKWEPC